MTVFIQRASQAYSVQAQPYQLTGSIPAGVTQLQVSLTREGWANYVGRVVTVSLIWPDGTPAPFDVLGGALIGHNGLLATSSSITWNQPNGFTSGTYTLSFQLDDANLSAQGVTSVTSAFTVQGS